MTDTALWRARPVFLTSTFRDMQAERDHLRDFVFPVLEERLRARREYLEPIDLRQGVETLSDAEAQVRELEVLKVCLEEVRRSRPFLIGLLGDRYGWIPPEERMKAAAEEAGFKGEVAGRSVTELEIAYGLLADAGQRRRSRFYFREPLPYESMSKNTAAEYAEVHNPASTSAEAQERLKALKTNIKEAVPERWRDYPAAWDASTETVTGLEAWGAQVLEDLWEDLEAETRESEKTAPSTWQGAERWVLEQFIESRARGFIGRETLRESLVALATTQSSAQTWGLSLTGVAGSGKSAVFARLYRDLEQKHGDKVLLLAHAAGTSPRAARIDDMLGRWVEELATHLGIDNPLDENAKSEDIEQAFSALLGRASTQTRVVVLIDALDQLERTPRAQELTWLQKLWPPNARLITTAIPGKASQALSERVGVQSKTLGPLTVAEAGEVAEAIYARYHRRINPAVRAAVLEKTTPANEPACGNPLWLEMAVEALNLLDADDFARAERDYADEPDPQQRLQRLALDLVDLMPGEVDALYGWVLNRAQKLHGEAWTRAFVNLIAVSRAGWREQDFTQLIPTLTGEHWDELKFAALRRTLRAHVVQRGAQGQWAFVHQQLHRAVHDRYLTDAGEIEHLHTSLADYLEGLPQNDPLHESETMVHLIGADAALRAARYYGGAQRTTGELKGATDVLAGHILEHVDSDDNRHLAWVLGLMHLTDLDDVTCERLCSRFIFNLNDALENARLALRWRLLEPTRATLERLAALDPGNADWQRDLSVSHIRRGDVLSAQGDLNGALGAFRASHKIHKRLASQDPGNAQWQSDLSTSHNVIGNVLSAQGDLSGAVAAYSDALGIAECLATHDPCNTGWQHDLSISHSKLGDVLSAQGDLNGALATYSATQEIFERLATRDSSNKEWQRDLSVSHINLGDVLSAQGDLNGALAAFHASLKIAERLAAQDPGNAGWQRDLSTSHSRLGNALSAQGDLNGAIAAYRASFKIAERLATQDPGNTQWQQDLSIGHEKIGNVLSAQGDLSGALSAYSADFKIAERLTMQDPGNAKWQRGLSVSYNKLGDVLSAQGDLNGALATYCASLEIAASLAALDQGNTRWQYDISISRDKIGSVLDAQGDLNGALASYRNSLSIVEGLAMQDPGNRHWQRGLSLSHKAIGDVLSAQGDLNGALTAYRTSFEIVERLAAQDPDNTEWQSDLSFSHIRLGKVLSAQGDLNCALTAYRASLEITASLAALDPGNTNWQYSLALAHGNVGGVLQAQGDLPGALQAYHSYQETMEQLVTKDSDNAGWQRELATGHSSVGSVLQAQGNLSAALKAYRSFQESIEQLVSQDPSNTGWQHDLASARCSVGSVLHAQGNLSAALRAFRTYHKSIEQLVAKDLGNTGWQYSLALAHGNVGSVLRDQGDLPSALQAYHAFRKVMEQLVAKDSGNSVWQRELAVAHCYIGVVFHDQGDLPAALQAFRANQESMEQLAARDPSNTGWQRDFAAASANVASVLQAQGELAAALQAYRAHKKSMQQLVARDPSNAGWQRDLAASHCCIGIVLQAQGELPAALQAYRSYQENMEQLVAKDPGNAGWQRDLVVSHYKLATIATQNNETTQAKAEWARCRDTLYTMRKAGMFLDAPLVQLLDQLDIQFGTDNRERLAAAGHGLASHTSRPTPHPDADPDAASRANIDYQRALIAWKALPFWKRFRSKKPEPPK